MDTRARQATVHGVAKNHKELSNLFFHCSLSGFQAHILYQSEPTSSNSAELGPQREGEEEGKRKEIRICCVLTV